MVTERCELKHNNSDKRDSLKFLCSYGGKILPRPSDGKLRYFGGLTRVLSVDRSISFAELMVKLGEFCGYSVELKCQLPNGDLETLVSIKSDEELANLVEEYHRCCPGSKIRAVLSPPKLIKTVSPPPSTPSSLNSSPRRSVFSLVEYRRQSNSCSPPAIFRGAYYDSRYGQERSGHGLLCHDPRCVKNWH